MNIEAWRDAKLAELAGRSPHPIASSVDMARIPIRLQSCVMFAGLTSMLACFEETPFEPAETTVGDTSSISLDSTSSDAGDAQASSMSTTTSSDSDKTDSEEATESSDVSASTDNSSPSTTTSSESGSEDSLDTGDSLCTPGQAQSQNEDCGNCGLRTRERTCLEDQSWGEWSPWGDCQGEGACAPGQEHQEKQVCDGCGSQERTATCTKDCAWGPWGEWSECASQPICFPGDSEVDPVGKSCGNCGKQYRTRTCADDGCSWEPWSDYGSCEGEGECRAGEIEPGPFLSCGNCGTQYQTRTCTSSCGWGNWGKKSPCANEGVCTPGSKQKVGPESCGACDGTKSGEKVCNNSCDWNPVAWGDCVECQSDPKKPQCSSKYGVCECEQHSNCDDGSGGACCVHPAEFAKPNFCAPGWLPCRYNCESNDECSFGNCCKNSKCEPC